jgi:hypothetical protein
MMALLERLRALGLRRAEEGNYTDQNICELAIEAIELLNSKVSRLTPEDLDAIENALVKAGLDPDQRALNDFVHMLDELGYEVRLKFPNQELTKRR